MIFLLLSVWDFFSPLVLFWFCFVILNFLAKLANATPSCWEQNLEGAELLFFASLSATAACNELLSC